MTALHIGWPQAIYLSIVATVMLFTLVKHGQPRSPGEHDFFESAFFMAIQLGILWWGGFFTA